MIFLFLCVTVLTSLIYIVSFVRRGAIARSTMWFVALTLVFFLYSFTLTWSESGFDDLDPLAEGAWLSALAPSRSSREIWSVEPSAEAAQSAPTA